MPNFNPREWTYSANGPKPLEGGEVVTSTITCEAVKELGLTIDKDVTAIVKATEVMVMA